MSTSIHKPPKKLGVYQLGEQIGKGAKGIVYKGINVETASIVAIKQISIENIGEDGEKAVQMEINLLKRLKHENIVKYIDAIPTPTHLYIILEYVDAGCLHSVIDKFGPFPETLVAIYIKQVLTGLDYLHSQGVVHRDIKGANILTTKEGLVKLADFGVATKLTEGEKANSANSVVGTPYWMAPEIIEMRGNISTSCDIWSVGCTVLELLTGSPPYFDLNKWSALFRIVQDDHPPIPTSISQNCKDFLLECFEKEAVARIDAKGLLNHPWIRSQNHQALDIMSSTNQLPQEVTNTIRNHMDKIESLPVLSQQDLKSLRISNKSVSDEDRPYEDDKSESKENKRRTSGKGDDLTETDYMRGKTSQRILEPNNMNQENQENSLYRLTHSTVEGGRDSVNKSYSMHGMGKDGLVYMEGQLHGGDNIKNSQLTQDKRFDDLQNFGTLQEGSFLYGENPDGYGGTPSNIDHKDVKAHIKKLGYVMGTTVPQQEYKFVKEISNLVLRLSNNSPFIEESNLRESMNMQEDFDHQGESARMQALQYQMNQQDPLQMQENSYLESNIQETLQDLQRLEEIFIEFPVSRDHFMRRYGLTGLIDILEQTELSEVKEQVLQVINTITFEDSSLQEKACLFGILPYIIKYASSEHPKDLRVQAARFLGRMSEANHLPFHMFLSAGGFKALVELLDIEYEKNRDLVGFAVEMLGIIFERKVLQTPHLCRIMVKLDVFQRLIIVVGSLYKDAKNAKDATEAQEAEDFLLKALNLMNNFATCEDSSVREHIGKDETLPTLVLHFKKFQCYPHFLSKTARILAHLLSEPSNMERVESIRLLPEVVKLIAKEQARPAGINEEALADLLKLLFQMCQLDAKRQEEVVENGGIEILMELKNTTTKKIERLVISTLCQFVETSEKTRNTLWENGGPKLFLNFLDEESSQPKILGTIASWLEEEAERVEDILIEPSVFNKLVNIFKIANKATFQQIAPIFLQIIERSELFTSKLSKTSEFLREIVERLGMEPNTEDKGFDSKNRFMKGGKTGAEVYGRKTKRAECINPSALVKKELLEILVHLCLRHENPRSLMNEHNLYPIILQILHLSQNDEMVIITEIATLLLRIYSEGASLTNRYDSQALTEAM